MHDEAPPFGLFIVSSLEKTSGDQRAQVFVPIPKGLPYRAQPVYESNAAMATAEARAKLSVCGARGRHVSHDESFRRRQQLIHRCPDVSKVLA
jgi:hypothetical protein